MPTTMPTIVPTSFVTCPGADPHITSDELRSQAAVHPIDFPVGAPAFVVVDHDTNTRAFTDPRLSKRLDNAPKWFREQTLESSSVLASNMLLADPPDHTRLRKLVSRAFLPRRMERLRPRIQRLTDDLIDAFPDSGDVDLMETFAYPLPLMVICEFLGMPYEDHDLFLRWGKVLSQDPGQYGAEARERKLVNDEVVDYFTAVLANRRETPRDDLAGDLVRAADNDGVFSDAELVSTMIFLIIAGHKTTANLIGNGMAALLSHPDQLARLRAGPDLVIPAVEEFLRYEGSVDRGTLRVATEDLVLSGVHIPKGSFVHLSISAANRDPAVFEEPGKFDITRGGNKHLTFGHGAHFCAGAPLARLEGQVGFTTLLQRLPVIELAIQQDEVTWVGDSSISRGVERLPIRFTERLARTPDGTGS